MNLLENFAQEQIIKESRISVVTTTDLAKLKMHGYSPENLLEHLVREYGILLHGSRTDIHDYSLKPNKDGDIFATNSASIAILKAIISNRRLRKPGLVYPYFLDREPLLVNIHGIHRDTIGERGFVYVIGNRTGFINDPIGSWQYVRRDSSVPYIAKVEVLREDFRHPIFDVDNNTRI